MNDRASIGWERQREGMGGSFQLLCQDGLGQASGGVCIDESFYNLLLLPEPLRYKSIISASLHFRSIDDMKINVNNQKVNQYAAELCQNELLTYK